MANLANLGGNGALFTGEDKTIEFEVLDENDAPIDLEAWGAVNLRFVMRKTVKATDAMLDLAVTISGTFNAVRASNTQRAVVTIVDTATTGFKAGSYPYSLKRLTDSSETILAYGTMTFEVTTQV